MASSELALTISVKTTSFCIKKIVIKLELKEMLEDESTDHYFNVESNPKFKLLVYRM